MTIGGTPPMQPRPPSIANYTPPMQPRPPSIANYILYGVLALVVCVALVLGMAGGCKSYNRYQKRADANNNVKISAIEIRNQAQRVQIAKQKAQIRFQDAVGLREAQNEIAKTLTPLYVAFEMTQALQAIATSGQNNSVIYLPTNPNNGLPVVPTSNSVTPTQAKP